jgi:hypothetical protein
MKAVTSCPHTKSGMLCNVMPGARMLKMVVMKFMAATTEEMLDTWSERMAKSRAGPGVPRVDSGA